jgi:hypothetical protein
MTIEDVLSEIAKVKARDNELDRDLHNLLTSRKQLEQRLDACTTFLPQQKLFSAKVYMDIMN